MKRGKIILGRLGTVLIAISLALLLVSVIPQINLVTSTGSMPVNPEQVYTTSYRTLTPQQGLRVNVTVEGTVNVYLLEVGTEEPSLGVSMLFANATELQKFLDTNPNLVVWENKVENGSFNQEFTPTKVMNATLVFYNPTSEKTTVDYNVELTSSVAPGEKVRNIAYWAAPIGIILAIPWILDLHKQRKQS
jgi:hypothetical protein